MTRRLFIDSSGMRISLPGYDAVTDNNPCHFAFDTRNTAYFSPMMVGQLSYGTIAYAGIGGGPMDIMYPGYFNSAPPALIGFSSGDGLFSGLVTGYFNADMVGMGGINTFTIYGTSLNDRLRIFVYGNPSNMIQTLYYVVGQGA